MILGKWDVFSWKSVSILSVIGLGAFGLFLFFDAGQISSSGLPPGAPLNEGGTGGFKPYMGPGAFLDSHDPVYTGSSSLMEMLASIPSRIRFRPAGFKEESIYKGEKHAGNGTGGNVPDHSGENSGGSPPPAFNSGAFGIFSSGSGQSPEISGGSQGGSGPGNDGSSPGNGPGQSQPGGPQPGTPDPPFVEPGTPEPGGEPVPEPAVWILTLSGITVMLRERLRRRR